MPIEANLTDKRVMKLPTIREDTPESGRKIQDIIDSIPELSSGDYKKLMVAVAMIELDRYIKGDKKIDAIKLMDRLKDLSKDAPVGPNDNPAETAEQLLGRITSEYK